MTGLHAIAAGFETRTSVSISSPGPTTLPIYTTPTTLPTTYNQSMIIKLTIALALSLGGTYAALLLLRRRSLNKNEDAEGLIESFADNDSAYYCKKGKHPLVVEICKVHLDDKLVPFYTIRLPSGSEKQTVGRYLKRDLKDNDNVDAIGTEKSSTFFRTFLSNPWIVFIFFTSRQHQKVALMEAADEALADLDLAHSWPRLGSLPRNFSILLMLGYFLGIHSLTRLAVIGFKAFGAYYAMCLPYTYLTRPYYRYGESNQEAQY